MLATKIGFDSLALLNCMPAVERCHVMAVPKQRQTDPPWHWLDQE